MPKFASLLLPAKRTIVAPDGSNVRVLLGLGRGGMAHFSLAAGQVSQAVTHRTVEEIWYILAGSGQMWRRQEGHEEVTELTAGLCLTIPLGTHFQFRASEKAALEAIAVTLPPWPGDDEAIVVTGLWQASVA